MTAPRESGWLGGFLLLALLLIPRPASAALSCSASITDVTFGHVDILPGTAVDITANVNISCSGIGITGVRVCPYIGNGSGGRDASARYMQGATTTLAYQLYTDAARTVVWGDPNLGFGSAPDVEFAGNLGGTATGNTTLTLYARLLSGQSVPAGDYVSNFTTAHTNFTYGPSVLGLVPCNSLPVLSSQIHPTFAVSATVDKNCTLSATNINFGSHGILSAAVTANGHLTLKCTSTMSYTVALGNGNNGSSPTARNMKLGSSLITYGLYKDNGFASPWGDTGGTVATGTGSGANQDLTVYGRVPAQATPAAGTYTDTIIVTVTY